MALQARFKDRRFIPLSPPEFLNYPGVELLLIGAHMETDEVDLAPERESLNSADIFHELKLWRNQHTVKPLVQGHWA